MDYRVKLNDGTTKIIRGVKDKAAADSILRSKGFEGFALQDLGAAETRAVESQAQAAPIPEVSLSTAAFPAINKAIEQGRQPGFTEGAKDVFSLPGRVAGAATLAPLGYLLGAKNRGEQAPQTLGQAMFSHLAGGNAFTADPSLAPSLAGGMIGGPVAVKALGKIAPKAAPTIGTILGSSTAGAGAYEAAAQDPSLGRFGANVALGTALGGLGEGAKRFGMQSAKSALLPGTGAKVREGAGELVERMMEQRKLPFFGGIDAVGETMQRDIDNMVASRAATGAGEAKINVGHYLDEAIKNINDDFDKMLIGKDIRDEAVRVLRDIKTQAAGSSLSKSTKAGDVFVSLKDAANIRSQLGELARYQKLANVPGRAEGAREGMRQILKAEEIRSPEWRAGTKQMSDAMRMQELVDIQNARGDTRQPLGMRNALGGIMGGGILGGATQSPGAAALGMLLGAGAGNVQNSIGGGRAMWELGNLLQRSAGVGQAAPRALGIYKDER